MKKFALTTGLLVVTTLGLNVFSPIVGVDNE